MKGLGGGLLLLLRGHFLGLLGDGVCLLLLFVGLVLTWVLIIVSLLLIVHLHIEFLLFRGLQDNIHLHLFSFLLLLLPNLLLFVIIDTLLFIAPLLILLGSGPLSSLLLVSILIVALFVLSCHRFPILIVIGL